MSARCAILIISSLLTTSLSAMSSMEFVHCLIHLDHTVYYSRQHALRGGFLNAPQDDVSIPHLMHVSFIPNETMKLTGTATSINDYSSNRRMLEQLMEQFPVTVSISSLIKDRWNISRVPDQVRNLDDVLSSHRLVMVGDTAQEPVTFRTTFREPGTAIDINYQPLSRNVEVMALLSLKAHPHVLEQIQEHTADTYSTIEVASSTPSGSPNTLRIKTRYSLSDFASFIHTNDLALATINQQ